MCQYVINLQLPGLMMVGHGTRLMKDASRIYKLDVVCSNSHCTVSMLPGLMLVMGVVMVFAGTFRFSLFSLQTRLNTTLVYIMRLWKFVLLSVLSIYYVSFFQYISLQLILTIINVVFVISMATALDKVTINCL